MSKKGLIAGIVLLILVGGGIWYAQATGLISSRDVKGEDVIESMSKVKSFRFEGNIAISGNTNAISDASLKSSLQGLAGSGVVAPNGAVEEAKVDIAFQGSVDAKDEQHPRLAMSMDLNVKTDELPNPVTISMEMRAVDQVSYVRLNKMAGFNALGLSIGQSNWIRISQDDLKEFTGDVRANASVSPTPNQAEIKKITEQYSLQLRDIVKKYDLAVVKDRKAGESVDHESTQTIDFELNEEATIGFVKEALPVYMALVKDILKQMPQYSSLINDEDTMLTEKDYAEVDKGLREFFDSTTATFTATVGKRSAHLYNFGLTLDVQDPKKKEQAHITGTLKLHDFDQDFPVEAPADASSLMEFFQSLYGGRMGY